MTTDKREEEPRGTGVAAVPQTAPAPDSASPEYRHLDLMWRLAQRTTHSEMVPKVLRGRPDAALAVMVYGHELGLAPMTSLREVYIIEGTPSCSAKLMRALIFRAGHALVFRESTRERCVLHGTRADGLGEAVVTWTVDDARTAGLLGKDVWKKYPADMLVARATSRVARLVFPDVTIGYTPEELQRVDLSGEYDYVDVGAEVDVVDDGTPLDLDEDLELDEEDAELVDEEPAT